MPPLLLLTATSGLSGNTIRWFATSLVIRLASWNLLTLGQTDKTKFLSFPHQGPRFGDSTVDLRMLANMFQHEGLLWAWHGSQQFSYINSLDPHTNLGGRSHC